ncbi:MAG: choice-of-anchor J domain-containing protein [Bacteroidetes bacterium]|nr:choice-of-anchor J domain-containing protein [Bacteroidota bacterium]
MKRNHKLLLSVSAFAGLVAFLVSCKKESLPENNSTTGTTTTASFTEEFSNVGDLTSKGWAFRNNSNPVGSTGWRQGRYESAATAQYKFLAPVPILGFPAYSSSSSPNDFVSCDASCSTDAITGTSDISCWLISPPLPMKNGDVISFYTRAVDDSNYPVYCKDRMQVWANFTDGSTNVGNSPSSTGSFTSLLQDINPTYEYNDPAGYPRTWTKVTITISGLSAPITNGRFAFRYFGEDAGLYGGLAGTNYPTVVGVDQLKFVHE